MNLSAPFIRRPVGTTLLTVALVLAGIIGFRLLPVCPLPQVDFPTINVSAGLPGASPETMASAVAHPARAAVSPRIAGGHRDDLDELPRGRRAWPFSSTFPATSTGRPGRESGINAANGSCPGTGEQSD